MKHLKIFARGVKVMLIGLSVICTVAAILASGTLALSSIAKTVLNLYDNRNESVFLFEWISLAIWITGFSYFLGRTFSDSDDY